VGQGRMIQDHTPVEWTHPISAGSVFCFTGASMAQPSSFPPDSNPYGPGRLFDGSLSGAARTCQSSRVGQQCHGIPPAGGLSREEDPRIGALAVGRTPVRRPTSPPRGATHTQRRPSRDPLRVRPGTTGSGYPAPRPGPGPTGPLRRRHRRCHDPRLPPPAIPPPPGRWQPPVCPRFTTHTTRVWGVWVVCGPVPPCRHSFIPQLSFPPCISLWRVQSRNVRAWTAHVRATIGSPCDRFAPPPLPPQWVVPRPGSSHAAPRRLRRSHPGPGPPLCAHGAGCRCHSARETVAFSG